MGEWRLLLLLRRSGTFVVRHSQFEIRYDIRVIIHPSTLSTFTHLLASNLVFFTDVVSCPKLLFSLMFYGQPRALQVYDYCLMIRIRISTLIHY